jgi:hypothetical protein
VRGCQVLRVVEQGARAAPSGATPIKHESELVH